MSGPYKPVPGFYYVNVTGQLIKVKALLYVDGRLSRVIAEYLDGRVEYVAPADWDWLDLSCYNDWLDEHVTRPELEREI
jgi:hypothetical protein